MAMQFEKPRRLNIVSIILILVAIGGLYAGVQFGPPYWRKWKVKGVLSETANKAYRKRHVIGSGETTAIDELSEQTVEQIHAVGVEDQGLTVRIWKDGGRIYVLAEYVERVNHPLIGKTTTLRFRPQASISASGE